MTLATYLQDALVFNIDSVDPAALVLNQDDFNQHIIWRLDIHEQATGNDPNVPWTTIDPITGQSFDSDDIFTHWLPAEDAFYYTPKLGFLIRHSPSIAPTWDFDKDGTEVYQLRNQNSGGMLFTEEWTEVKWVLENLDFDFYGTAFETSDTLYRWYDTVKDTHYLSSDPNAYNDSHIVFERTIN